MKGIDPETLREIRINPIIPAESVLIATERGKKPEEKKELNILDVRDFVEDCPFCPGNEDQTPEQIFRSPEKGPWNLRVVRNLYPAFGEDSESSTFNIGVHNIINGYGHHEVIIDHSQHGIRLSEMSEAHLAGLFQLYRDRMSSLYLAHEHHVYVMVFKNFGPASGGSIPHTHSQIIAMPVIPINVEMEIASSLEFYQKHDRCIFCTLIDADLHYEATIHDKNRGKFLRKLNVADYFIDQNKHFIAIKPFASRYPWEVHILPKHHCHDFRNSSDDDCTAIASLVKSVMERLEKVLGTVQYNYFLHSSPSGSKNEKCGKSFHWHLEICPRTSIPNGFEIGSGLAINTVSPEKGARLLREAAGALLQP